MTERSVHSFDASTGVPPQVGPFSHAARFGDTLYVTGQMPTDPATGELVPGDVVDQARQVFSNLSAVLAQFGASLDDSLMVRVYLTDFSDFARFNEEYRLWFHGPLPARTCVGTTGLAVGATVEIDLIVGIPSAPATAPATAAGIADGTAADNAAAIEHFAAKLRYETDASDVAAGQAAGERFVLVDTRGHAAWHQARAVGAIHLPTAEIAARAAAEIPLDTPVVVYCWGPGCNGSTKAALQFSRLGYEVRELIGGFEYWAREGLPVVDDDGPVVRAVDALTGPVSSGEGGDSTAVACDC